MRILGIDPGSSSAGFGVIETNQSGQLFAIEYGVLEVHEKDPARKLLEIYTGLTRLLERQPVQAAGIEKLFFSKNTKTAFEVSQARGVILLCLLQKKIPFVELAPNEVKVALTNYGQADKKAVAKMVRLMLSLPALDVDDNASDALAIAIAASRLHELKF